MFKYNSLLIVTGLIFPAMLAYGQTSRNIETQFLGIPNPDSCRKNLFILTQQPHIAGSPDDSELAVFVNNRFKEYGINSRILTYYVYLPYPKSQELEMTAPEEFKFDLEEKGWSWDKDSYNSNAVLPFNAYSPNGDLSGQIIYANYGLPEDYDYLEKLGISFKGKIMLVRYGKSFRGIKVKVAEEHGAAGVIIYSDPQDDGYDLGDIYPRGPMRPWDAVQRGSIQDLTVYPGDPLTPGYASTKDARRIPLADVTDLPHIPCLPISYGNADKILSNLAGSVVPHDWQGGLPFAYHIGPGPAEVKMKIEMDYAIRPIWDVIGTIEGQKYPDEKVIIGNHRDAWVFGAVDPNSGTASMLETARGFGQLLKEGWKPERSITLCSWDGEEYGLIGSTEWGEQNEDELAKDAVVYINIDAPVSGINFGANAVPSLDRFIMDITKSVSDPKTQKSVFDAWYISQNKSYFEKHDAVPDTAMTTLGRLGSGSDFTVFLDHIGVPSFDFGFGGPYGVYHSALDNFYWMEHWGDPTFQYHATVAKLLGVAAIRLADDSLLPFSYSDYAKQIQKYVHELSKKADEEENLKSVDFKATIDAALEFEKAADNADSLLAIRKLNNYSKINSSMMEVERTFTDKEGLPQSPWFKHQIYAPGSYTGYASQPLPGVSRAIEKKDAEKLKEELSILDDVLKNATLIEDRIARETSE
ncbi:MAG TPA: M28 family metallopeptidase [Candidatus Acidoferrales bacterium]|nr:M28 family metallopeptidase [Candidatus Acidoferrales bacterium]